MMEILLPRAKWKVGGTTFKFDGNSVDAPMILELTGPFPETSVVASNPSGCLTVQLLSDGSVACTDFFGFLAPLSWSTGGVIRPSLARSGIGNLARTCSIPTHRSPR